LGTKKNQAAFFVAGCNLYDTDAWGGQRILTIIHNIAT
jgi:hypothetical protein